MRSFFARRHANTFICDGKVVAFGSDMHGTPPDYNAFSRLPRLLKKGYEAVMARTVDLLKNARPLA